MSGATHLFAVELKMLLTGALESKQEGENLKVCECLVTEIPPQSNLSLLTSTMISQCTQGHCDIITGGVATGDRCC